MTNINNPIALGVIPFDSKTSVHEKTIEDFLKKNLPRFKECTFINDVKLYYEEGSFKKTSNKNFLFENNNQIYQISISPKFLTVKLIANFTIKSIEDCKDIQNLIFETPKVTNYYNVTLINSDALEITFKLNGDSKCDKKKFESALSQVTNGFSINMGNNTFKEFLFKFFNVKKAKRINCYTNPGFLNNKRYLYKNALIDDGKILFADEQNCIKIENNKYVKLSPDIRIVPSLSTTTRPVKDVTKELIENVIESWEESAICPLVALGHMVMSIYFPYFKKRGIPTLIMFGETSTGKSTITKVGLAMFGFTPSALISGGSTVRSWEYFLSRYNAMCIGIDDVKRTILTSDTFNEIVKSIYQGRDRCRMKRTLEGVETIIICSPLIFSTNEKIPEQKEIINRLNIIEMFGDNFSPEKFKYHETDSDKLRELSTILPELIKISSITIDKLLNDSIQLFKAKLDISQGRVLLNLAYAYTGLKLLFNLAEIDIDKIEDKFILFAQKQKQRYENIEDVVDRVLSEILIQSNLGKLLQKVHFRIENETNNNALEHVVYFHTKTLITKINEANFHDKSKYIDISLFKAYCKTHKRFRGEKTVRYKTGTSNNFDTPCKSVGFCIDGLEDYMVFLEKENANKPVSMKNVPF